MTKPLIVLVPHQLGRAGARSRLDAGLARLKTGFGDKLGAVETAWTGDRLDARLSALGQSVTAVLQVEEEAVRVEVQLPWVLAILAEKAKSLIQKEGRLLLAKR